MGYSPCWYVISLGIHEAVEVKRQSCQQFIEQRKTKKPADDIERCKAKKPADDDDDK